MFSYFNFRAMGKECLLCLRECKDMINIFEGSRQVGFSVMIMISKLTGRRQVERGDMISEFMCRPCLWKAKKAFDIRPTKGESKQTSFQIREEDIREDLPENLILLDSESERPHSTQSTQVKNEESSEDKAIQRFLGQSQIAHCSSTWQKVWSCCTYILNKLNLSFFSSDSKKNLN